MEEVWYTKCLLDVNIHPAKNVQEKSPARCREYGTWQSWDSGCMSMMLPTDSNKKNMARILLLCKIWKNTWKFEFRNSLRARANSVLHPAASQACPLFDRICKEIHHQQLLLWQWKSNILEPGICHPLIADLISQNIFIQNVCEGTSSYQEWHI